jgi:hypothetical protein
MAISSPSSGLASSSQPSSTPPSLEPLLEELTALVARERHCEAEIKTIKARRAEIALVLDQMVEAGELESKFTWNDCKITRYTVESIAYPDHILEQRQQLKASERLSVALGEASVTKKFSWRATFK